ncbi:HAD hydrolase-like protein [Actinomycetospora endophytica]|uniref:HAD hydrolase-like protein n=1 Tax=Actinomycetospora endophytica TaxID=2291215 RepID=A0ABS8PBT2_9PSEU|nr:HAD hydrolase-like protein [Actinomycetospora endophytica]MCD2195706.1 HAD hydrolase-like protein [Actinomycetospora endophytica]
MSPAPVRAVVFDLDGTLVQTRVASWEVFEPISRRHGLGVDTPGQYFDLFRGNVFTSIRGLCSDEAQARAATDDFLAALRSSYSPPLVPGMQAVVRRLASECTLAVMSSNAMEVLRRVLVDNGLAYCFAHVFGGDVAPDKRTALRTYLAEPGSGYGRRCSADYDEAGEATRPDAGTTVLVTDTAGDVRDATEVGVRVVGVAWGMHSAAELTEAGAEFVALWPQEVLSHLLGDEAAREPTGACAIPGVASAVEVEAGPCSCGCSSPGVSDGTSLTSGERTAPLAPEGPGERRRRRRREAVAGLAGASSNVTVPPSSNGHRSAASDELLEAMRRICRA